MTKKAISNRILLVIFTLFFSILIGFFYQKHVFSFHFVDEEYNFALGKQINQGYKLYSDLACNHQPLAFIASSYIQRATNPNSIYLLIKRHREAMILYSAAWDLTLVAIFGLPLIFFVMVYELTKLPLLGNLFMPEGMVVYPLVFVLSIIFLRPKLLMDKKNLIAIGFLLGCVTFLLLPVWPLVASIAVFLLIKLKRNFLYIVIGGIIPLIFSLFFISLKDYYHEIFFVNSEYIKAAEAGSSQITPMKSILTPFFALFNFNPSNSLTIIRPLVLLILVSSVFLIRKKNYIFVISIFGLLTLANARYINPGEEYYGGFHLLVWYGMLVFLTGISFHKVLDIYNFQLIKKMGIISVLAVLGIAFYVSSRTLFVIPNQEKDFYINYSRQYDFGEAVRVMSQGEKKETLFVAPDEWLISWQSGLKSPIRVNTYYEWMNRVPELKNAVSEMFSKNPPTYFYCDCGKDMQVEKYFTGFKQLERSGNMSSLYVREEKYNNLTEEQKDQLRFLQFNIE